MLLNLLALKEHLDLIMYIKKVRDCIEEKEASFLQESCNYNIDYEEKITCCAICNKEKPENMLEMCECKEIVHLECFKAMFALKSKITNKSNYTKLVIDDYGCITCGKRYDSKLNSLRCIRQRSTVVGQGIRKR